MKIIHIGIDDTDSTNMGCTTYIAAVAVEKLTSKGFKFIDYPNLIRLNPNIPWKTRGNGAVALRLKTNNDNETQEIFNTVYKLIIEYYDKNDPKPQPVIAMHTGNIPNILREFSKKAINRIVSLDETLNIVNKLNINYKSTEKGLRGLIGAVAAIGEPLDNSDYTYELLVYRPFTERSLKRNIDEKSILQMDEKTHPYTFSNIDKEEKRILITPHGPDPVILGIRGENPEILIKALKIIKIYDPIERWVIYRTNQGTDAHLIHTTLNKIEPYMSAIITGTITSKPTITPGGHVFFKLNDTTGTINIAVYKETGTLNKIARKLLPGDIISVAGGIKPGPIGLNLNAEKITIIKPIERKIKINPKCPKCNKNMSSIGKNQGYKCKKCGYTTKEQPKYINNTDPDLKPYTTHFQTPKARRHLTKPPERYGKEKQSFTYEKLYEPWHWP